MHSVIDRPEPCSVFTPYGSEEFTIIIIIIKVFIKRKLYSVETLLNAHARTHTDYTHTDHTHAHTHAHTHTRTDHTHTLLVTIPNVT